MRSLLLSDLKLGLADLVGTRAKPLLATAAGKLYYPGLLRLHEAIEALPAGQAKDRPLAEELAATDGEHDGFGAAIWHYVEAIVRAPNVDAELKTRAERVRAAFIPSLGILRESYASEAAGATERRPRIAALRGELEQLPVPEGRTLLDWVEAFVARGEQLLALLTRRASIAADQDTGPRHRPAALRNEAISTLTRFRSALADELAAQPAEARERDREIFAFLDQLAADRQAAAQRSRSPVDVPEALAFATDSNDTPRTGTG